MVAVAIATVVVVVVLNQWYCCAQRPAKAEGPIGLLPIQTAPSNCSMGVKNRFGPCHALEHALGDSNRLGCCFACPFCILCLVFCVCVFAFAFVSRVARVSCHIQPW